MEQITLIRDELPEPAKDLKINLENVLKADKLSAEQAYGVALSAAYFLRDHHLRDALLADAQASGVTTAVIEDARAAAAIMGMNTIYYRFRHLVHKEAYEQKPARLRMQRMLKPASGKANFEIFSLACAALAGCEMCIKTHEASILQHGLSDDHVHDAVRIAAVIAGVSVAMGV